VYKINQSEPEAAKVQGYQRGHRRLQERPGTRTTVISSTPLRAGRAQSDWCDAEEPDSRAANQEHCASNADQPASASSLPPDGAPMPLIRAPGSRETDDRFPHHRAVLESRGIVDLAELGHLALDGAVAPQPGVSVPSATSSRGDVLYRNAYTCPAGGIGQPVALGGVARRLSIVAPDSPDPWSPDLDAPVVIVRPPGGFTLPRLPTDVGGRAQGLLGPAPGPRREAVGVHSSPTGRFPAPRSWTPPTLRSKPSSCVRARVVLQAPLKFCSAVVNADRAHACRMRKPAGIDRFTCEMAAVGHPNVAGAAALADAFGPRSMPDLTVRDRQSDAIDSGHRRQTP
jgi:hypothetical protein